MGTTQPASFAQLLKRHRLASGLTQEALAERAHLSREAVSALERGERQYPRTETVDVLAEALELADEERSALRAAAVRPSRPRQSTSAQDTRSGLDGLVTAADPAVPVPHVPMPPTPLLGRSVELADAFKLLVEGGSRLLTGPDGVGKTRLALAVAAACRDCRLC